MKEHTKANEAKVVAGIDPSAGTMVRRRELRRLKTRARKRQARYSTWLIREQQEAA